MDISKSDLKATLQALCRRWILGHLRIRRDDSRNVEEDLESVSLPLQGGLPSFHDPVAARDHSLPVGAVHDASI